MTDYFGEPWPSGVCEAGTQRPTPLGEDCAWCKVPIAEGDQGVLIPFVGGTEALVLAPWHKECFLRTTVGSVAHLEGRCSCHGDGTSSGPQTPAERRAEAQEVWARTVLRGSH